MTAETDAEFLDSMEQWVIGSLVFKAEHRKRLFALARRGAEAADRIEQLEAALRCVEEECDALMVMEDGETLETLTGYSRGAYFTAKYIKTRAALGERT